MSKTTSIINNGENLVLEEFKTIDSKKSLEDLKDIENEENPINDTTKNSQETSRKQSIEIPVKEKEISLEEKFKRRKTAGDLLFEQLTMKVTENVLELPNLCDSKHLLERNTLSFKCLAQLLLSSSSLNKNRLFLFPPLEDPGIKLAFDFQEPEPIRDDIGAEKYKQLCQEMEIVPISRIIKCLETDTLDLKYYGLTNKQIRALTEALKINSHVQTLILQDNWLTVEMTQMLSDMLVESTVLQYLSLRECRIGLEGAQRLGEILSSLQALKYMDLSFNELGDEGLLALKDGLCENTSIKKLNLSHNQITEDSGECLETILMENKFIEELDLSWSGFFTGQGNRKLFKGLLVSDRLKVLNLAWNGIGIVPAVKPITRYLRNSKNLEELDLSNNRLMGKSLRMIRTGINNNHSLKVVKLGNNIYTPDEAHFLLTMLAGKSKDPLHHLDMANMYIKKDSKPVTGCNKCHNGLVFLCNSRF
ncbi:hypothetical protein ABEB36_008503 [Hypothenemus hampei]|uniref:Uncharacterized protein n=1 Tax=Hypothenemus hampei TaxID=57062 RepID=A0ABD1EM41_HYPHA